MAMLALVLYLAGLGTCFGVRTWWHYRTTGDSGFRCPAPDAGTTARCGAVLFVAALIAGLVAPVLGVLGLLDPWPALAAREVGWTGLAVAVVGFVATVGAQAAMGSSWRIGVREAEETELVTTGAFRWSRNPIFAAMVVAVLGLTIAVPNVVQVVALVTLVVAVELQVRGVEEPYLLQRHGSSFAEYASRTGRFVPFVGRLPQVPRAQAGGFMALAGGEEE